jgi:predicted nucleic acid-binding Zn ribbon protein
MWAERVMQVVMAEWPQVARSHVYRELARKPTKTDDPRHCLQCGALIPAPHPNRRYCSELCLRQAQRRSKRMRRLAWIMAGMPQRRGATR